MTSPQPKLDESLYSRQLYVMGHDAMKKMGEAHVLIVGLGGLGVEIAKNVILSGVKSVTLHDTRNTTQYDLGSQFYLTEADIGKNRALACRAKLAELNPYVSVVACKDELDEKLLKTATVVVLTDATLGAQLYTSTLARKNGVSFINTATRGITGQIFCDFGPKFIVTDTDGENPLKSIVANISCDSGSGGNKVKVTCVESNPHNFTNDFYVTFAEVRGTTELNNCPPTRVKVIDKWSFELLDTKITNEYKGGGIVTQVKMPLEMKFLSLEESCKDPEFNLIDYKDFGRAATLHKGYLALHKFYTAHKRYPAPWDEKEKDEFLSYVDDEKKLSDGDKKVLSLFALTSAGQVCAVQAVVGSIVSQEVLKACSGKFTPIKQWMYFDSFDSLPLTRPVYDEKAAVKSRYYAQMQVFGNDFQKKIMSEKVFIVGAGAIGCELLKNFALSGLENIVITDMDTIEKSNLNRQFLFRSKNIGQPKSVAAAAAIREMNPAMKVTVHQNKVGTETECVYDEKFFSSLLCVANALDNVPARLFVDGLCVANRKPLLESGTLGTKGNVQVVVPHITESYGSSRDAPEQSIPVCTLKNFPYEISHTIQFARDMFEGLFTQAPQNARKYIEAGSKKTAEEQFLATIAPGELVSVVNDIKTVLGNVPKTFDDCIRYAYLHWHEMFRNNIMQLLSKFPADKMTESGVPFWSGTKRCPHPLKFNKADPLHMSYVVSLSNLWAFVHKLKTKNTTEAHYVKVMDETKVPDFVSDENVKISANEEEEKEKNKNAAAAYDPNEVMNSLSQFDSKFSEHITITPIEFEKDDDTNFHMDFITAFSNLRASNYDIKPVDKHTTKGIAGKIIPAIATTTSLVSGLVTLELYKLVNGCNKVEQFRDTSINLALPFMQFFDPKDAKKTKCREHTFTLWDSFDLKGDITVEEFIDYFKDKFKFEIEMATYGTSIIFADFMPNFEERKKQKITDVVRKILGPDHKLISPMKINIAIADDGIPENADIPNAKLYFA